MRSSILLLRFSSPKNYRVPLLIFLAGMLSLNLVMAWNARSLIRKGYPDFTIFYGAAKMLRQGFATRLYDPLLQYQVQQQFAGGVSIRQGALPYNHPPFEALLFLPLTALPYFPAYLVWNLLNVAALIALPFLLRPHIPLLQRVSPALFFLAALAFFPVFVALLQGQDTILMLLLFCLAFVSLKKDAQFSAGCWLGLALFRFHLVLPLILMLLWQRKAKVLLGFSVVASLLACISLAIIGWQGLWRYPSYVLHVEKTMGRGAIVPSCMPNLRGLIATLNGGSLARWWLVLVVGISLALLLWVADLWKQQRGANFDLGFSAAVILTVLVSYHAFAYDLSLLLLPVFLLLDHWGAREFNFELTNLALLVPVMALFFTPLIMVLWFNNGQLSVYGAILLLWVWGFSREITRLTPQPQARSQPVPV